jgi:hypothetical protein
MNAITMDQIPAIDDPVHLLAIADSKVGKSVYAAQAALDGFDVIYMDADNGISALRYALKNNPEAQKRVRYIWTNRPMTFLTNFLRSSTKAPMKWMPNRNQLYSKLLAGLPDDEVVWTFDSTKIPKEWLFVGDSWTATAMDALEIGSAEQKAELLDGTNQAIYGSANSNLTYICNMLQKVPYHVMIQAHGAKYEVYDKPLNTVAGQAKQKDMILREIKDVPLSSSRPHGETMVSRFNHIGWLYVNAMGGTDIDFTRKPGRVGGGPPNRRDSVEKLSFKHLVGGVPAPVECNDWMTISTHGELKKS